MEREGENEESFAWSVDLETGCFQLGSPSEGDDLYTFNTTLVNCENLHLLSDSVKETQNRQSYIWKVVYKAFDCDIASDPFQLNNDTPDRRTFIGDKATARIRSSGGSFFTYLDSSRLHVSIFRAIGINGADELVGEGHISLRDLTSPQVDGLKCTVHLSPPRGKGRGSGTAGGPLLRVLVELGIEANYFNSGEREDDKERSHFRAPDEKECSFDEARAKLNKSATRTQVEKRKNFEESKDEEDIVILPQSSVRNGKVEERCPDSISAEFMNFTNNSRQMENCEIIESGVEDISPVKKSSSFSKHPLGDTSKEDHECSGVSERGDEAKHFSSTPQSSSKDKLSLHADNITHLQNNATSSPPYTTHLHHHANSSPLHVSPRDKVRSPLFHEPDIIPSGTYAVTIELLQVWIRSSTPLLHDYSLSFFYSPLGILRSSPISCKAKRDPTIYISGDPKSRCAIVHGGSWQLKVLFNQLSDPILRDPIVVELRHVGESEIIANASIPFGQVFFADQLENDKRVLADKASIISTNGTKIGSLTFSIQLKKEGDKVAYLDESPNRTREHLKSSPVLDTTDGMMQSRARASHPRDLDEGPLNNIVNLEPKKKRSENQHAYFNAVTHEDLEKMKRIEMEDFREELKEKERAYLMILSEEWEKREQEREERSALLKREICEQKERLNRKETELDQRETHLAKREREMEDLVRKTKFDSNNALEDAKLRYRRLKEQCKAEVELLGTKIDQSEEENQKLRSNLASLERKLKAKEDEIDKILAKRTEWPSLEQDRINMKLEMEAKHLKDELKVITIQRDYYRNEAAKLASIQSKYQEQSHAQLFLENEKLRKQLLLSQELSRCNKEHETVEQVHNEILNLKEMYEKRRIENSSSGLLSTERNTEKHYEKNNNKYLHHSPSFERGERERIGDNKRRESQEDLQSSFEKYKNPRKVSKSRLSREQLDKEITRLVSEKDYLIGTGIYETNDPLIRELDNALTSLASQLSIKNN